MSSCNRVPVLSKLAQRQLVFFCSRDTGLEAACPQSDLRIYFHYWFCVISFCVVLRCLTPNPSLLFVFPYITFALYCMLLFVALSLHPFRILIERPLSLISGPVCVPWIPCVLCVFHWKLWISSCCGCVDGSTEYFYVHFVLQFLPESLYEEES